MNTLRKVNNLVCLRSLRRQVCRLYSGKDQKAKPQDKPKAQEKPKGQEKPKEKPGEKPVGKTKGKGAGDPGKKTAKVTMINGEGVGPELMSAVQEVMCAVKAPIEWDIIEEYMAPDSEDISSAVLESLRANKVGIKGPVDSRHWQRQIRKQFSQFAYVSLCSNIPGLDTPYGDFDVVIIRDQMEGDYSGIEHSVVPGVMQTIKVSTTEGASRIAEFVFDYAVKHQRKKITVAHKANIMRMTDGNFLEAMRAEAEKHVEKIRFEERYLDTCILNILTKPHRVDVLVSSSMYGDVMRVLAGGMMGVPGISPGYSVSSLGTVFDSRMKACHALAGKDQANPTGPLLCAALMLRHLKMDQQADQVDCAVRTVYKDSDIRTPDVGGKAKCSEFVKAVVGCLDKAG
ncbi:probable isocitrate dehydrogenase [NAD] subunit alpha, mitochondrial [Drosophila biarmipes]|uniref:probable isocitrate dehydrogenase [NAD] subunit alpha, mitochondrial n=1 Tax=Drosophila biarmipes TaxID=125945 RepID=UPI0007E79B3E|nr:probable isocitrate dehydrogenase [NAD] subunit alpha, mitochondrial [Drosophila biarmipes]